MYMKVVVSLPKTTLLLLLKLSQQSEVNPKRGAQNAYVHCRRNYLGMPMVLNIEADIISTILRQDVKD